MDKEKAFEIMESKGVIDVSYNGSSVWIENVIEETDQANVRDLKTNKRFVVGVSQLKES
ncbi:MAG: H-type small acid-soluble spore protein [Clostridiaceae bacterium]